MHEVTNECFGLRKPALIEHYKDQVGVYENIYSKDFELSGETVTFWYAAKSTYYTQEEYASYMDLAEDRAVTTSYENTIELIEELRPE